MPGRKATDRAAPPWTSKASHAQGNQSPNQTAIFPAFAFWTVLLLLVGAALAHYLMIYGEVLRLRDNDERLTRRSAALQMNLREAEERIPLRVAHVNRRKAILGFARNRFAWAGVLEKVNSNTPQKIQLTSLEALCMGQDECVLRLRGCTTTPNARLNCDKFRIQLGKALADLSIATEGNFTQLEERESGSGNSVITTTEFAIEFTWRNHIHGQ